MRRTLACAVFDEQVLTEFTPLTVLFPFCSAFGLCRIFACQFSLLSIPNNELNACSTAQVIELSSYLEKRISGSAESADQAAASYSEVGKVVTVGDGIARVYGLNNVQAGEVRPTVFPACCSLA